MVRNTLSVVDATPTAHPRCPSTHVHPHRYGLSLNDVDAHSQRAPAGEPARSAGRA